MITSSETIVSSVYIKINVLILNSYVFVVRFYDENIKLHIKRDLRSLNTSKMNLVKVVFCAKKS